MARLPSIILVLGIGRAARDDVGAALSLFREHKINLAFLADYPPELYICKLTLTGGF